mmetsp:Transcript_6715/g.24458  ORF Transcript_6715/g.24458 Transcript_6715/m.24458 type:complete len:202 (-) Transcript_6715:3564-4169(-)
MRRMFFGQDEVLEVELNKRLTSEPSLRHGAQKILRRNGFENWNGERQILRAIFALLFAQVERLVMINVLVDWIFHPNQPSLKRTVHVIAPLKLWYECHRDTKHGSRDWLHHRRHVQMWHGTHARFYLPSNLRVQSEHTSDFTCAHIPQSIERSFLFFKFIQRFRLERLFKLPQLVLMRPNAQIARLAHRQQLLGERWPSSS